MKNLKSDFPIFNTFPNLVYLDSAATSQKPKVVIEAVKRFYEEKNANVHRGIYKLAEAATEIYEGARMQVAEFINAKSPREIIFTGNTNLAINIAAYGWAEKFLKTGDIIVISDMEHHANIVPWLRLKEKKGVELVFLPVDKDYRLDYKAILKYEKQFNKIKLIALTQASNVLGTINPLYEILSYFKSQGINSKILIDGAQSVPHIPVDVQKLGIDFLAFSAHKMLGPTGVGVLWGKEELLSEMDPFFVGSNMISTVTKEKVTWADLPDRFEAGTGNLEGAAGLSAAISYIRTVGFEKIVQHENDLTDYALERLMELPYLQIFGAQDVKDRLGIFSFGIKGAHPHDISQILDSENIAIRSGHHCAQIMMRSLSVNATARASVYIYNTKEDIDMLINGIEKVKRVLKV